eukprot:scaffold65334_cov32-Tisochrysis_lutea.AAC.1
MDPLLSRREAFYTPNSNSPGPSPGELHLITTTQHVEKGSITTTKHVEQRPITPPPNTTTQHIQHVDEQKR